MSDEKLMVVIDFISYLQAKSKIPNKLTLKPFEKTYALLLFHQSPELPQDYHYFIFNLLVHFN